MCTSAPMLVMLALLPLTVKALPQEYTGPIIVTLTSSITQAPTSDIFSMPLTASEENSPRTTTVTSTSTETFSAPSMSLVTSVEMTSSLIPSSTVLLTSLSSSHAPVFSSSSEVSTESSTLSSTVLSKSLSSSRATFSFSTSSEASTSSPTPESTAPFTSFSSRQISISYTTSITLPSEVHPSTLSPQSTSQRSSTLKPTKTPKSKCEYHDLNLTCPGPIAALAGFLGFVVFCLVAAIFLFYRCKRKEKQEKESYQRSRCNGNGNDGGESGQGDITMGSADSHSLGFRTAEGRNHSFEPEAERPSLEILERATRPRPHSTPIPGPSVEIPGAPGNRNSAPAALVSGKPNRESSVMDVGENDILLDESGSIVGLRPCHSNEDVMQNQESRMRNQM